MLERKDSKSKTFAAKKFTKKGLEGYFPEQRLIVDLVCCLTVYMKKNDITKKELAKRLGKKTKYVNKILDGENLTLKGLARILDALDVATLKELYHETAFLR